MRLVLDGELALLRQGELAVRQVLAFLAVELGHRNLLKGRRWNAGAARQVSLPWLDGGVLAMIQGALAEIDVEGERYPAQSMATTGR